jgi:hypothetical protein
MKVNVLKGLEGYAFFILLAAACIVTGAISFKVNIWAAVFAILLGLSLLAVAVSLILRKK